MDRANIEIHGKRACQLFSNGLGLMSQVPLFTVFLLIQMNIIVHHKTIRTTLSPSYHSEGVLRISLALTEIFQVTGLTIQEVRD